MKNENIDDPIYTQLNFPSGKGANFATGFVFVILKFHEITALWPFFTPAALKWGAKSYTFSHKHVQMDIFEVKGAQRVLK